MPTGPPLLAAARWPQRVPSVHDRVSMCVCLCNCLSGCQSICLTEVLAESSLWKKHIGSLPCYAAGALAARTYNAVTHFIILLPLG